MTLIKREQYVAGRPIIVSDVSEQDKALLVRIGYKRATVRTHRNGTVTECWRPASKFGFLHTVSLTVAETPIIPVLSAIGYELKTFISENRTFVLILKEELRCSEHIKVEFICPKCGDSEFSAESQNSIICLGCGKVIRKGDLPRNTEVKNYEVK